MEEKAFTADGFSPFEEHRDHQEREGRLMKIFSGKSVIPRKKRSARVGIFNEERMMGESPLELLASVAVKCSELNDRVPLKKRKFEFLFPKEQNRKKKMKWKATEKNQKNDNQAILTVPPMAEAMAEKIRRMGGERVEFVIEKQLCRTDLTKGNSRLSIPLRQTRTDFLSETEKTILNQHMENQRRMRGIEVIVIDPRLEELNLCLKMWKMSNNFVYNLIRNWNQLAEENQLKEGDRVRLWAFRVEERRRRGLSDLCFALAKVEDDNNGGAVDNDSSTSTVTTHDQRRRSGLSDLCFALAKVEDDNNGGAADNDSSTSTVTTHDQN